MLTEDTQLSGRLLRIATVTDRPQLIPLINSAIAVETFLDGTLTDAARLTTVWATSKPAPNLWSAPSHCAPACSAIASSSPSA